MIEDAEKIKKYGWWWRDKKKSGQVKRRLNGRETLRAAWYYEAEKRLIDGAKKRTSAKNYRFDKPFSDLTDSQMHEVFKIWGLSLPARGEMITNELEQVAAFARFVRDASPRDAGLRAAWAQSRRDAISNCFAARGKRAEELKLLGKKPEPGSTLPEIKKELKLLVRKALAYRANPGPAVVMTPQKNTASPPDDGGGNKYLANVSVDLRASNKEIFRALTEYLNNVRLKRKIKADGAGRKSGTRHLAESWAVIEMRDRELNEGPLNSKAFPSEDAFESAKANVRTRAGELENKYYERTLSHWLPPILEAARKDKIPLVDWASPKLAGLSKRISRARLRPKSKS